MGGNALKINTIRQDRAGLDAVYQRVSQVLYKMGIEHYSIPELPEKVSFGDLDVLVCSEDLAQDYQQCLVERLGSIDCRKNGGVFSLDVDCFQVDLICHPKAEIDFARNFYGYGDFGALLSRLSRTLSFKLGAHGFFERYKHDGGWMDVPITRSFGTALTILGYDAAHYRDLRWQSMEDVFAFLVETPFFDPTRSRAESGSNSHRRSRGKRPMQARFEAWITEQGVRPGTWVEQAGRNLDTLRAWAQARAMSYASDYPQIRQERVEALALNQRVRRLVDVDAIREATGLDGRELGAVIKTLRHERDLRAWATQNPPAHDASMREYVTERAVQAQSENRTCGPH